MKKIPLTKGKFVLVDDEDFGRVHQFKWYLSNDGYASRNKRENNRRVTIRMHRFILSVKPGENVDHISGDRLDNRRSNLRLATRQENAFNRGRTLKNKSGYKGVSAKKNRWLAQITRNYKVIYLGLFKTKTEASLAYKAAAKKYHGEFAHV